MIVRIRKFSTCATISALDEDKSNWARQAILGAALIVAFAWSPAAAQNLAKIPGQDALVQRMGGHVVTTCGGLAALGVNPLGTHPTQDLFGRCRELVHTGNVILGTGATAFALPITAGPTNDALRQLAHEETAAQGTGATETANVQLENVGARIAALRGGASGINLSGLNLRSNGMTLPGTALASLVPGGSGAGLSAGGEAFDYGRLGAFVSGTVSFGDRDPTVEEAGFDFYTLGITGGLDYRFTNNFIAGVALGYEAGNNDFDAAAGEIETDAFTISLYGSVYTDNFYVDFMGSATRKEFDITRNIVYPTVNRVARGDTHGEDFALSLGGGYDFNVESWTFGPYARADYTSSDVRQFTETGAIGFNLSYRDQDIESLATVVGGQVSYAISTSFGVVVPHARAEWMHEFKDDSRLITVSFAADPNTNLFSVVTDSPDRDRFNLGVGLSTLLAGGITLFADYEGVLGLDNVSNHTLNFGARFEF